jgi:PIN domain nuclease of toxin-antitoxin system
MLIAQAEIENLTLVTPDRVFKKYKIPVIKA